MTGDSSPHPRPKPSTSPQTDRRKVNVLKGMPLINGLGLVFIDRRSYRERRSKRRNLSRAIPCALLQHREDRPAQGLFRGLRSGWEQTAVGTWIKRHLKNPWRPRARLPGGPP